MALWRLAACLHSLKTRRVWEMPSREASREAKRWREAARSWATSRQSRKALAYCGRKRGGVGALWQSNRSEEAHGLERLSSAVHTRAESERRKCRLPPSTREPLREELLEAEGLVAVGPGDGQVVLHGVKGAPPQGRVKVGVEEGADLLGKGLAVLDVPGGAGRETTTPDGTGGLCDRRSFSGW